MWHRISGDSLKVTFDVKLEEDEEEGEESKSDEPEFLRIAAEVLKVDDGLHCVDFQLKKHLVKKPAADGKELEEVEQNITYESRQQFVDFVRNTLLTSKYIKDYIDAKLPLEVASH